MTQDEKLNLNRTPLRNGAADLSVFQIQKDIILSGRGTDEDCRFRIQMDIIKGINICCDGLNIIARYCVEMLFHGGPFYC